MDDTKHFIAAVREKLKTHLFDYQDKVKSFFLYTSFFVSFISVCAIIIGYGFYLSPIYDKALRILIFCALTFYTIRFIFNYIYSFSRKSYVKKNIFEFLLVLFYIVSILIYFILGTGIMKLMNTYGVDSLIEPVNLLIKIYFFLFAVNDIAKYNGLLSKLRISPAGLLVLSFAFLIILGTVLLSMPRMTYNGINFIDALFTATSAACVTGLAVNDVANEFTFHGHIIIMLLIQFGGWNIITFAAFFSTFLWDSSGIKYQSLLHDVVSTNTLSDTKSMLRKIVVYSLSIEIVGAVLLFIYWNMTGFFDSQTNNIFYSLFHSISAFNNAGFTLWSDSLYNSTLRNAYFVQSVLMILVFLGGIGFFVLQEFFSPSKIKERKRLKWKKLSVNSSIAINTSLILIFLGALLFFILEYNNSLTSDSIIDKFFASLFQSVSSRTAGFNSVDFSQLENATLFIIIILMFIGASPASTGGGIKTTTFFVLIKSVISVVRSSKHVTFRKNTIPYIAVNRSFTLFFFAVTLIVISTFALSVTEPDKSFMSVFFEEVSAFGTVGLSTGITPDLSYWGKIIIIISMFLGRVGLLTFGIALSRKIFSDYKYPDVNIFIG